MIEIAEVSKLHHEDSSIEGPTFYTLCCCVPFELLLGNVGTLFLQMHANTRSSQTIQMTIHIFLSFSSTANLLIEAFLAQCDMNSGRT